MKHTFNDKDGHWHLLEYCEKTKHYLIKHKTSFGIETKKIFKLYGNAQKYVNKLKGE